MSPELLVTLPVLLPVLGSLVGLAAWRHVRVQRAANVVASVLLLLAAAELLRRAAGGQVLAARLGGWPSPVAITFVADVTSAIMVLLNGLVAVGAAVYALGGIDRRREAAGFHPLMLGLFTSVSGAFLTADLFNLYVWFEVMLMSSFVLLALGGTRSQLKGALTYVTLSLVGSMFFLAGIGLTYAMLGTLNLAQLAERLAGAAEPQRYTPVAAVLLVAFLIKSAAFPFFAWLPASYHTPPPVISAVFAGLLTKVGVYVIIRFTALMFPAGHPDAAVVASLLTWIAALTMVTGVLAAAAQGEVRRILSFHIISQIGYMLMGIGIAGGALAAAEAAQAAGDPERAGALRAAGAMAMTGAVFYVLHHIVVKANLFLVAGIIERRCGSGRLTRIGGLASASPRLSALFMVPALSLAGIPVLSGFWSKFVLVRAGLAAEAWAIVAVSLLVSVMTLFSMMKIWSGAFWKPAPETGDTAAVPAAELARREAEAVGGRGWMEAGSAFLALVTVAIGLLAGPAIALAERGAEQLIGGTAYRDAALDRSPRGAPPPPRVGGTER
ncbi:proton-conducting transporter transmembrane domain-containing protein [Phycisphaera mikurensis]|uniref:Na(+)/H(+) antiporter subunit D n=1 Tax=Phycisphaera mikurensis (strain NBRC 102666 / KCTC 22515 / FYK2301M01) TaxID=1142394 RepID=I0IC29_PHYMF|nr:proton-conducting transporter membrane subunit [Phycisphaera mikurensis]MBB6441959.1 multicomponent Na+:H+ antiporter subunit D [Phycisphaera mikurensis]BAM02817.1 Na(+)/H(+) antiporter subunit D [Phycisphaera mikurensis NBRC 102666]